TNAAPRRDHSVRGGAIIPESPGAIIPLKTGAFVGIAIQAIRRRERPRNPGKAVPRVVRDEWPVMARHSHSGKAKVKF
ncbi:hypothetical protein, partial [Methylosinus sp. RM1]|uniref:hypothetical protein n=1 Tax=Methylosinus sp. RM1 TaxID=2583817 RepID=UPI001A9C9490